MSWAPWKDVIDRVDLQRLPVSSFFCNNQWSEATLLVISGVGLVALGRSDLYNIDCRLCMSVSSDPLAVGVLEAPSYNKKIVCQDLLTSGPTDLYSRGELIGDFM